MPSVTCREKSRNTLASPAGPDPASLRLLPRVMQGSALKGSRLASVTASLALALLCTGCPVGGKLDGPYQDYIADISTSAVTSTATSGAATTATATTVAGTTGVGGSTGVTSTGATATTGPACDINMVFNLNCSSNSCHGTPGGDPTAPPSGLFLFGPPSDLMRLGIACPAEYIINPTDPMASLMLTTLRGTAACGVDMPQGFPLAAEDIACVEQWVLASVGGT